MQIATLLGDPWQLQHELCVQCAANLSEKRHLIRFGDHTSKALNALGEMLSERDPQARPTSAQPR